MKLKEKLKNWLLQEELQDIKETKEKYDELHESVIQAYHILQNAEEMHDKSHTLLENCRKFMNSICDVGTDVGFRTSDHSWAVICVHGKKDFIRFVDMRQSDIRTIVSFLKNFEYSNRVIDSPLGYQQWINDEITRL